ncbi:MAG: sugar ABC transporter ATP-binding protein, partial [Fimbriimonadales bacterium]
MNEESSLLMTGIGKSFDGVEVLHSVDFDLMPGEVHALVGENGAGKSTLMKIAAGVHQPNEGSMTFLGQPFAPRNPFDSLKAGIAMVHQELSLAPDVSIAENILAGREPLRAGFVRWHELYAKAGELMAEFGLDAAPDAPVSVLSAGYRQIVEVLKALASDPRVVIFDEPTSSLEAYESALVLRTIRRLAERGIGVVYISHRMQEVFQIADRVTVLRDGYLVASKAASETSVQEVVNAMVGRALSDMYPPKAMTIGDELIRVEGLSRKGKFADVSFTLHRGEILGFSGLVGSGRTEVMRTLFGADRIDSGAIYLGGRLVAGSPARDPQSAIPAPGTQHSAPGTSQSSIPASQSAILSQSSIVNRQWSIPKWSVPRAISSGLAYVPEDRKTLGLFLDRSIEDNLASANLERCSRGGVLSHSLTHTLATEGCRQLAIKARDV